MEALSILFQVLAGLFFLFWIASFFGWIVVAWKNNGQVAVIIFVLIFLSLLLNR
tara:strand:+ start:740 stop:901 length:162 start_codon:yes stop_codon:yes gene_type:complete